MPLGYKLVLHAARIMLSGLPTGGGSKTVEQPEDILRAHGYLVAILVERDQVGLAGYRPFLKLPGCLWIG
jgi:hypothetical protein